MNSSSYAFRVVLYSYYTRKADFEKGEFTGSTQIIAEKNEKKMRETKEKK